MTITKVGFGCARLMGGSQLRASTRLIEAALAAGIRHFDTAPAYGEGESEAVLGEVLSGVSGVTVATKIGIPRPELRSSRSPVRVLYQRLVRPLLSNFPSVKSKLLRLVDRREHGIPESDFGRYVRELTADEVLRELDHSMRLLKRSRLDLYLLHEPDQFLLTEELLEVFAGLQRNGTIGAFGLAYGRVVETSPPFGAVLQSRYADRSSENRPASGPIRIFHGVFRHGWHEGGRKGTKSPSEYVAKVLAASPNSSIIISASSTRQIRELATNRE